MISAGYPDGEQVLSDLGGPFVNALIDAVDGARDDFNEFREWKPSWVANFTNRFTANFLHERIWDRLVRAINGLEDIRINDREPIRELCSGARYFIRIKRHHSDDRISAYPTEASSAFWTNGLALSLNGLEVFSLAAGYYWDADLRAVGEAVLSFRDGKDNPIWAVRLRRDPGQASGFSWTPIAPDLPEIDLSGITRAEEEDYGS